MRMLRKYAAGLLSVTVMVACTSAYAGVCDKAMRGTYGSNVCWLVEEFTKQVPHGFHAEVASFDEEACTVTLKDEYGGVAGGVIHFDRADPTTLTVRPVAPRFLCWEMTGEGVSSGPNRSVFGDLLSGGDIRENRVTVCGLEDRVSKSSVNRAMVNLYDKYCAGAENEF